MAGRQAGAWGSSAADLRAKVSHTPGAGELLSSPKTLTPCPLVSVDLVRGGVPGLHGAPLLQVRVQQLPGCPLQGGWDLSLWGGHQPVPD